MPTVTIAFTAMNLACDCCGQQAHVARATPADIVDAANAWWGEHYAPTLVSVEGLEDGVEVEWVRV